MFHLFFNTRSAIRMLKSFVLLHNENNTKYNQDYYINKNTIKVKVNNFNNNKSIIIIVVFVFIIIGDQNNTILSLTIVLSTI